MTVAGGHRRKDPGIRQLASGSWQATWRDLDGRQRGRSFPTKREAREFRDQMLVDLRRGDYIDPRGPRQLLGDWVELWLEAREVQPTTAAQNRTMLNQYVLPRFGRTRLGAIMPLDVQAWVRELEGRGLSRATVSKAYTLLCQIMGDAATNDLIGKTPCRGIRFDPKAPAAREARALTTVEAARLLEALAGGPLGRTRGEAESPTPHPASDGRSATLLSPATRPPTAYTLVLSLLGSGMRWGEAVGLRRQHIHLLHRPPTVEVVESLHEANGQMYLGPPKTRSSQRTIPLPAVVAQTLAAYLPPNGAPGDMVFTTPRGAMWRRGKFGQRHWLPAVKAAGLDGLHVHDLRHTFASWLADAGIPEVLIAAVLGHQVGSSVTAGYTRAIPGFEQRVIEALDERLGVVVGGLGHTETGG